MCKKQKSSELAGTLSSSRFLPTGELFMKIVTSLFFWKHQLAFPLSDCGQRFETPLSVI